MKVHRDNSKETNKTTAWWLYEFGYDLAKNAQNVDYLREYLQSLQKNKKFSSIEEKLADIRSRVGLDLATKISQEINQQQEKKSHQHCHCQNSTSENCSCQVKMAEAHSDKDVNTMKNILEYIRDMIKHEPHLNAAIILARCKAEEGLCFDQLSKKIDQGKLVNYINNLLDQNSSDDKEKVRYTPAVVENDFNAEDTEAEYYNHAEPSHY